MFTKDNYAVIDPNWDKDAIQNCCKTKPTGDCKCDDCCYDSWNDELNQISSAYNIAVENAQQLQNKVDFTTSRRDRYKGWITELDKAEMLARDVCDQLKLTAIQSDRIWYNACEAVNAIEILYCMITDILMQVDDLKKTCDDIDNCVNRNNDPCVNKGQGILKYYGDFKTKLDATVKTRDDLIKNIIDAVATANLITNGISTKDCKCKDIPPYNPCDQNPQPCAPPANNVYYYGFKTIICEWYYGFACDKDCTPTTPQNPPPCDCDFPTFDFPICANSYRWKVQGWVDTDTGLLSTLTVDLSNAKIRKEGLLACRNSLDIASKAVNPKDRCK
jgi:hypothetical protein